MRSRWKQENRGAEWAQSLQILPVQHPPEVADAQFCYVSTSKPSTVNLIIAKAFKQRLISTLNISPLCYIIFPWTKGKLEFLRGREPSATKDLFLSTSPCR